MSQLTLSSAAKNSVLSALNTAINAGGSAGTVKIYTGTKPAGPDSSIGAAVLLGTLTLSTVAAVVSLGVMTFNAITQDSSADASGTATWARIATSAGTAVIDIDVTGIGGGGTLELNTVDIVALGPISISSFVITA